jgi:hypothetical protein
MVLLHGYSDSGESYSEWKSFLVASGIPITEINIGSYVTLNNEITIDDIAEGFEFALQQKGLGNTPFDAMVHSTGMLVLRSWLTAPGADDRVKRLKHLIALAPATFGSPLAAKGRSLLGRIFKGSWKLGPDFLNSGDQVLFGLELGSPYTWNLAHQDMLGHKVVFGPGEATPYVFVFDGTNDYGLLAEIFDHSDQLGSDGTVRWAGCALNTRKIVLDLTAPGDPGSSWSEWTNIDSPLIPIGGVNHGEILRNPPEDLRKIVLNALAVNSKSSFDKLILDAQSMPAVKDANAALAHSRWQQFIVRARDIRGNPVIDFSVQIIARKGALDRTIVAFEDNVHPYTADKSYRCFHVNLEEVFPMLLEKLIIRITASTGTALIAYEGFPPEQGAGLPPSVESIELDISKFDGSNPASPSLFYPFTTTLIEIILNRQPIPRADKTLEIFGWI